MSGEPGPQFGPHGGLDAAHQIDRYQADVVLGLAEPQDDDRYLDLGVGTGGMVHMVGAHVAATVGVDRSLPLLATLRGRAPAVYPVAGDAGWLPFREGLFTLVTCDGVLHHVADPARPLVEARRVLRPGGRLLVVEPVGPEQPVLRAARDEVERARDPGHVAILALSQVRVLLEIAGFRIGAVERQTEDVRDRDWIRLSGGDLEALRAAIGRHRRLAAGFRALRQEDGGFVLRRERAYFLGVRR